MQPCWHFDFCPVRPVVDFLPTELCNNNSCCCKHWNCATYSINRKLIHHTRGQLVHSFLMWMANLSIYLSTYLCVYHPSTYYLSIFFSFIYPLGFKCACLNWVPPSVHGVSSSFHGMALFLFKKKINFNVFSLHPPFPISCLPPIGIYSI